MSEIHQKHSSKEKELAVSGDNINFCRISTARPKISPSRPVSLTQGHLGQGRALANVLAKVMGPENEVRSVTLAVGVDSSEGLRETRVQIGVGGSWEEG